MADRGYLKLSQALRMYYGKGFQQNKDLRACTRLLKMVHWYAQAFHPTSGTVRSSPMEEIASVLLVMDEVRDPITALNLTRMVVGNLTANYTSMHFTAMQQCAFTQGEFEKVTEPVVDVYIVSDASQYSEPINYDAQATVIGELAHLLDISPNASHMGIYANDPKHFEKILPMNRTMPEAELKCRIKRLPIGFLGTLYPNPLETVNNLDVLFKTIKRDETYFVAAPAKVLLFLQRIRPAGDENKLKWRMMEFRRDHPDVIILGFGPSRANLEPYVRLSTDIIMERPGLPGSEIALPIYERLQKVGSALYFPFCERDLQQHHTVQFVIGPNERRYHTMISQNFNNSKNFRIEILGQGFPLLVCHSRSHEIFFSPLSPENNCQPVPVAGSKPVTLLFEEPCLEYRTTHCPEIHLMIESNEPNSIIPVCTDEACRTSDAVRYTISLIDAHCGCEAVQISAVLLLITLYVSLYHNMDNIKY